MTTQVHQATATIDDLLRVLGKSALDEARAVEEHLAGARIYLLGAMPEEYALNLELARQATASIPESSTRKEVETYLDRLASYETRAPHR